MEQKLHELYLECVNELKQIGIDILDQKQYGKIKISISKRNNKRYKVITKIGKKYVLQYFQVVLVFWFFIL